MAENNLPFLPTRLYDDRLDENSCPHARFERLRVFVTRNYAYDFYDYACGGCYKILEAGVQE